MPDELGAEADPRSIDDLLNQQQADVPLPTPRPEPIDPRAMADMNAYFRSHGSSSAAGAAPSQYIPDAQRRSVGVEQPSKALYDEIPQSFYRGSVGGVTVDLMENAHSPEYIQRAISDMYEGMQGHAIWSGQHPFLNNPKAATSDLANQLGARELAKRLASNKDAWLKNAAENDQFNQDFDKALEQGRALQQYPQIPF